MFKPKSDEEYVDQLRRSVARHDRWRAWRIGFHVTMAVAGLAILVFAAYATDLIGQAIGARGMLWMGFVVGALIGAMSGLIAFKVGYSLAMALSNMRTQRLLVRYHDALAELARRPREVILNR